MNADSSRASGSEMCVIRTQEPPPGAAQPTISETRGDPDERLEAPSPRCPEEVGPIRRVGSSQSRLERRRLRPAADLIGGTPPVASRPFGSEMITAGRFMGVCGRASRGRGVSFDNARRVVEDCGDTTRHRLAARRRVTWPNTTAPYTVGGSSSRPGVNSQGNLPHECGNYPPQENVRRHGAL